MALQAFGPDNEVAPAPSLMGSLEAGAQLGTQLRGQDIAANEAKDRLSLAYAQLQSQEERAAEQAQAKLNLAHATLLARQQQQDLMAGYREQALKQQAERDQERNALGIATLAERQKSGAEMMDLRERRLQDLDLYRTNLEAARTKSEAAREKEIALREAMAKAPRLTPSDQALLNADVADLKNLEKKIATTEPVGAGVLHWMGGNIPEINKMKAEALDLRKKIAGYTPKERQLAIPSTGGGAEPAAAAATPFKEGALIRSKKDGKLYRVKNGEPVLEEQNANQSQ